MTHGGICMYVCMYVCSRKGKVKGLNHHLKNRYANWGERFPLKTLLQSGEGFV